MRNNTMRCRITILKSLAEHKDKEAPKLQLPNEIQQAKLLKELSAHDRSVINGHKKRRIFLYDERNRII